MADYRLIYWPVPFRGQFIRAILAYADKSWDEAEPDAIVTMMDDEPAAMPIPFMGPPVLVETATGFALSQMPAIVLYLGLMLDLLPSSPQAQALAIKVTNDANDVLDELTLDGGKQMWTPANWRAYQPRLVKWMRLWEELGRRHGLAPDKGFLLGGDRPTVADIVTSVLWSTLTDRFPTIRDTFVETAPLTAALSQRMATLPALARLAEQSRSDYGDSWCGGEIEASFRRALAG